MRLHRIRLDDGQWADVHDALTFGMRLDVREAATQGCQGVEPDARQGLRTRLEL